jgi:hypothetical protein
MYLAYHLIYNDILNIINRTKSLSQNVYNNEGET